MLGYLIIALSLVLFVQAKNVYPQLLLGRLFFSLGGAAASTMVTAILPAVASGPSLLSSHKIRSPEDEDEHGDHQNARNPPLDRVSRTHADSLSSDSTITPSRLQQQQQQQRNSDRTVTQASSNNKETGSSSSRVAGFVGLFTGVGALIALAIFLPLPARFQKAGTSPGQALQDSYYIVAAVALVLSLLSFFGLRGLEGEGHTGILAVFHKATTDKTSSPAIDPFWLRFGKAFTLGFHNSKIGLGYVGGFVARASSVGISLFIPLAINAQFRLAGLCNVETLDAPAGLPDIKRKCPRAYTLSAELTGVSQLIALLAAPVFGYLMSRFGKRQLPLIIGALAGIAGYTMFGTTVQRRRERTNGTALDFVAMALIGISQIAAIVCSLGILSDGVLDQSQPQTEASTDTDRDADAVETHESEDERAALIGETGSRRMASTDLKGSIAGLYSLYGGAGILILTKLGGALFDSLSFGSPFYIMAIFNGILLAACLVAAVMANRLSQRSDS